MSPIASKFEDLKSRGEKALVAYVTIGDPSIESAPEILRTIEEAGADIIEVGVPFSDPIGDGPTIQASTQRALDRGVTPLTVFEAVKKANLSIPVVAMGYFNTVDRMGGDHFAELASDAGVSGAIIVDLTPEEADDWSESASNQGIDRIFLMAPTSTEARIEEAAKRGSGFAYAVSRLGVTGAGTAAPVSVVDLVNRIKQYSSLPVCVGFGISQPEHVKMVCQAADGAVVGSSLVQLIADEWNNGAGRDKVFNYIQELKEATK
jgi:tryptophan synthase alpha chain